MSRSVLVYLALALGAIAAVAFFSLSNGTREEAGGAPMAHDPAELQAMLDGSMKKLTFHAAPKPVPATAFETADGGEGRLADLQGKHVLLNFWATWCAPCRKEMPMLSELQTEFGGEAFEVVTIATGRNPPPAMAAFFEEIGVDNLPLHRDPKQAVAREMGIAGLPVTVLLDPEGREIARMMGDAEWNSDSAKAMIAAWIGDSAD
ncbi:TlpA family protein disulfide reductase [Roseovarius sp. SCSIO 43702]|uniref:TlpA family protein disulfide reductase n=1 Tax=Roseovarius sp. SCSIO 43702 TaxID=2823043 RepID=UPI001C72A056|nr:TlpA disulfide reductase family protein [Roseovarius sp. SCSIO 43702]QYX57375.1 TlpA family protein disulfide reductase [Roseovarius sp. SCSIO 43702]